MSLGSCPICDREMIKGPFVNKHHLVPKCKGGRKTQLLHKICHRKIHSLFTEKELEKFYNTAESLREHPEIQKFIIWIAKKNDPNFYERTPDSKLKKRKK